MAGHLIFLLYGPVAPTSFSVKSGVLIVVCKALHDGNLSWLGSLMSSILAGPGICSWSPSWLYVLATFDSIDHHLPPFQKCFLHLSFETHSLLISWWYHWSTSDQFALFHPFSVFQILCIQGVYRSVFILPTYSLFPQLSISSVCSCLGDLWLQPWAPDLSTLFLSCISLLFYF